MVCRRGGQLVAVQGGLVSWGSEGDKRSVPLGIGDLDFVDGSTQC